MKYENGMEYDSATLIKMVREGTKLRFRHFKGSVYVVDLVATNADDLEPVIVYHQFGRKESIWTRSAKEFFSEVDHSKYPDVTQRYRFELIKIEED